MSKKYYGRSGIMISRDTDSFETHSKEPSWFADFVSNLEKEAVKSRKDDYDMFNQINNIIGNKSKYSTVEEAVLDMQKRTGLLDFLAQKKASENNQLESFKEIPELKIFIDNYVEERPGTSVDSVVHDLLKIKSIKDKLPQGDDVPVDVKHYINDKILEAKTQMSGSSKEDMHLGEIDLSTDDNVAMDNDPFGGCTPARK